MPLASIFQKIKPFLLLSVNRVEILAERRRLGLTYPQVEEVVDVVLPEGLGLEVEQNMLPYMATRTKILMAVLDHMEAEEEVEEEVEPVTVITLLALVLKTPLPEGREVVEEHTEVAEAVVEAVVDYGHQVMIYQIVGLEVVEDLPDHMAETVDMEELVELLGVILILPPELTARLGLMEQIQ